MKYADLKVGETYWYDSSSNWTQYDAGQRAVLISTDRYRIVRRQWRADLPVPDAKGNAVMVEVTYRNGAGTYQTTVPYTHLRGLWDDCEKIVKASVAQLNAQRDAERSRREGAREAAYATIERARRLGLPGFCATDGVTVTVDMETLSLLLHTYEEVHGRVEG